MRITKNPASQDYTLVVVEHTDFDLTPKEIRRFLEGYDVFVITVEQKYFLQFMVSGLYEAICYRGLGMDKLPSASIAPIDEDTLIDLCIGKDSRKLK